MKTNFCKKSNDVLNIKDNLIVLGNNMETDQNIYNVDTFRDKLRMEFLRYKNSKNKGGRADHKMNLIDQIRLSSFKIKIDIKEIPLCYRIYIQQNRIFEQDVYELFKDEKQEHYTTGLYESLTHVLQKIPELEQLIAQYETENIMSLDSYRAEKVSLARELEEYLRELISGAESAFFDEEISAEIYEKFTKVVNAGFKLYDYWIDARL